MPAYDRLIDIQQRVVTRDSFGGEVVVWDKLETVWANVNQTGVSEDFENEANREQALRNAQFRIRWRSDVTEAHRVIYDGHAWDIEGLAEEGFHKNLLLYCQTDASRGVLAIGFTALAGLSDDDTPDAAELTVSHVGSRFTFAAINNEHVLFARSVHEPDIATIVDVGDSTQANQFSGWKKYGFAVDVDGTDYNVWVSEMPITKTTQTVFGVA